MSLLSTRLAALALLVSFASCQDITPPSVSSQFQTIQGTTMGTYYRIQFQTTEDDLNKNTFDQLFEKINQAVSTYDSTSLIRAFNRAPAGQFTLTNYPDDLRDIFRENIAVSNKLYEVTHGAFDPTVMPLVNFWGFGFSERQSTVREIPDDLLAVTGWDKIDLAGDVEKKSGGTQLDFSGVAKGYAVDQAGLRLQKSRVTNYLIDIGGEMRASGLNERGKPWTIGINRPAEGSAINEIEIKLNLANRSLATSGNYRNFHVLDDGQKVSHTINPNTGYPERTSLLSVTVVSSDCAWADGLATAGMVMGLPAALDFLEGLSDVEGFFIYADVQGVFQYKMTSGFHQLLIN